MWEPPISHDFLNSPFYRTCPARPSPGNEQTEYFVLIQVKPQPEPMAAIQQWEPNGGWKAPTWQAKRKTVVMPSQLCRE